MTIQPKILIFATHCLRSLMDRISDSGSDGCGSIPHGGTKWLTKSITLNSQLPNPAPLQALDIRILKPPYLPRGCLLERFTQNLYAAQVRRPIDLAVHNRKNQ